MTRRATLTLAAALAGCGAGGAPRDAWDREGEDPATPAVIELRLDTLPQEAGESDPFEATEATMFDAITRIASVRDSAEARGLFLRLGPMRGGWGRIGDLREALALVREAGKKVHCHFEVIDNAGYALAASVCDRISMTPAGDLELVGPAAHVFYARSLLESIGIRAELLQMGRFKGAADPFTRDDMPEETRESLGALLDDLHAALVRAVASGRDLPPERVTALIDEGPFDGARALAARLVDDVQFDDAARQEARAAAGVDAVRTAPLSPTPPEIGVAELLGALSGNVERPMTSGPRIALVHLSGSIVDAEEDVGAGGRSGPFVRALRRLGNDIDVKAVVLRIDSPGGSALASDRMWHAVHLLAKKKAVFVSLGDMAASGGYYIASAGTEIIAHESTIVGSIGVVGGKFVFGDAATRLGVHIEVLSRGANAAMTTPTRPFTDSERAAFQRSIESTYERFISRVALGRSLPRERVLAAAEGRIMSGTRAREAGLITAFGGLREAVRRARERAGLEPTSPIEQWPARRTVLDAIAEGMGAGDEAAAPRARLRELALVLDDAGLGAVPLPSFDALATLGRENVVVSLPFALSIR